MCSVSIMDDLNFINSRRRMKEANLLEIDKCSLILSNGTARVKESLQRIYLALEMDGEL